MLASLEDVAWHLSAPQFKARANVCTRLTFQAGSTIVRNGSFVAGSDIQRYAAVPLTYIEAGTVAIIENGVAVKQYGTGECLGLFETAHFIVSGQSNRIGRWDVKATDDVILIVSSSSFLRAMTSRSKQALVEAARQNPVAKPLTRLPLLDWFAKTYKIEPQKDTVIVYHSHVLPSSQEFIKHLAYVAGAENTFVLEKPYSTIPKAFRQIAAAGIRTHQINIDPLTPYEYSVKQGVDYFWQTVAEHVKGTNSKQIIIVSDGADILLSPIIDTLGDVAIVGIEQTARGLARISRAAVSFPVISIAATATKKQYESPFIADAALAKIFSLKLVDKRLRYGVIGAGSIGQEIIRGLLGHEIRPLIYDAAFSPANTDTLRHAHSLEELVQQSDIIIGTTGTDCLRGMYIERLRGHKTFISTSSSNIEFAFLFDLAKRYANSFEDVLFSISDVCSLRIVNGGYPINFDRTVEWEPQQDIQLTRALLYAGVYEALTNCPLTAGVSPLRPDLEQTVANRWLQICSSIP